MYCLYWKHADEIVKHRSMIDFIFDYQDVIDNKGLEVWWKDEPLIEIGKTYDTNIQDWMEMDGLAVTVLEKAPFDFIPDPDDPEEPTYRVRAEFFVKASELKPLSNNY